MVELDFAERALTDSKTKLGLTKFVIFQIGDIHFPSVKANLPRTDLKDSGFPDPTVFQGSSSRLDIVAGKCAKLAKKSADAVLFMGDLTTNGDIPSLQKCATYVGSGLANYITTADEFNEKFMFVPGNHDVERPDKPAADFSIDGLLKFKPFGDALTGLGFTKTSISEVSKIELSQSGSSVDIFGINTCLGCGELRILPNEVQREVAATIHQLVSEVPEGAEIQKLNEEFVSLLSERIDAAVIDTNVLAELSEALDERATTTKNYVPVVVGHHNLLPQTTPRIATYSEMVNSGKLRSLLQSSEFPAIYLHGHIHDDPVEIISSSETSECGIISISAPLFELGFNIIEIFFDTSNNPLGIVIDQHRYDENGQRKRIPKKRIPFQFGKFRLARTSALSRSVFNHILNEKIVYFADLRLNFSNTEQELAGAVSELEWLGSVEIKNHDQDPKHWLVSASL